MDDKDSKTATTHDVAVSLLTELFNAVQRFEFADQNYENARDARKMAKEEVHRLHLIIKGEVPRIREEAARTTLLQEGMLELPDIAAWRADLTKIVGGPDDGASAPPDMKTDDLTGPVVIDDKGHTRFGRFVGRKVAAASGGLPADEYELECTDCAKQIARCYVTRGEEAIVRLRQSAKTHLDLFHDRPEPE